MFWLRNKKTNSPLRTLIWRPDQGFTYREPLVEKVLVLTVAKVSGLQRGWKGAGAIKIRRHIFKIGLRIRSHHEHVFMPYVQNELTHSIFVLIAQAQ